METKLDKLTLKRLDGEIKDLLKNRINFCQAIRDEDNPLIFYFLLRGDDDSHYHNGFYLGKIILPSNYPSKPGDFMMLTPNGRFEINKKICLTNSGYHSNDWNVMWSIRNMIIGFYSIFIDDNTNGISHIKMSKKDRINLANESINYNISNYSNIFYNFDQFIKEDKSIRTSKEEIDMYLKNLEEERKKKKEDKKKMKKIEC